MLLGGAAQPATHSAAIHRHFSRNDRETGRYQYVPFEVTDGAESLTIAYRYSGDAEGVSTIDLGLFEPGSLDLGTASFRGYSGGAQRSITVGRTTSSPGYRAGPLPPGTWRVLLGLYKVAADGVDVDIDVVESREKQPNAEAAAALSPAHRKADASRSASVNGLRWYAGALHVHTNHSDGTLAPAAVAAAARDAGLDFVAITDHNNTTWTREPMPASPLAIVGEELTTPAGHASVWGLPRTAWIDFRVAPDDRDAAAGINALAAGARRAGALVALNHPAADCAGCAWRQVIPDALDAVEIWNGETGPQEEAIALWNRLLRSGRRVTAVGASDWHRPPAPLGAAAVRVRSNGLTEPLILGAIRDGRVVVMRDASTPAPAVTARCGPRTATIGDTLRCTRGEPVAIDVTMRGLEQAQAALVVDGTRLVSKTIGGGATFSTPAADGHLRVDVFDRDGTVVAITNAIHVTTR